MEVAPAWLPVPPPAYGGIEWIVHWLSEGLHRRGHDVLLVTVGSSRSNVPKRVSFAEPPPRDELQMLADVVHTLVIRQAALDFQPDVIHDHTLAGPLLSLPSPHIVTAHGPTDGLLGEYYRQISEQTPLIAISDAQRRALPEAHWLGTVHNAIDVTAFPFTEEKDDYLLFLGRICEDKGTHIAARAARRAGRRLIVAGRATEPQQREYFEAKVAPLLGNGIEFVGEADWNEKRRLLAGASALLCPLMWDEPFGLVLIEALACGTPVIAFRRGAAPEIVDNGVTGALVDDEDEMVDAIRTLDIDPRRCRMSTVSRFDVPRMVDRYEELLRATLSSSQRSGTQRQDGAVDRLGFGPDVPPATSVGAAS